MPIVKDEKKRGEIVAMLTQAYWMEIETVMSYIANSVNLDGVRAEEIKKSLEADWEAGALTRGASTITQQLARQSFLTLDKTWGRKIQELILAERIEDGKLRLDRGIFKARKRP